MSRDCCAVEETINLSAEGMGGSRLCRMVWSRAMTAALLALVLGGLAMHSEASNKDNVRHPRFSPDGKSLVFDRCKDGWDEWPDGCRIHIYNLEAGTLGYYVAPPGQTWRHANYSYAGDRLVFVTEPIMRFYAERHEIMPKSQIAVMNLDGSNLRVVTATAGFKGMPAFSHSGRKVIYSQAARIRDGGATLASRFDLWELDLESGAVKLFAGRFEFYQMGLAVYFPDDERVLLKGYGPSNEALAASGLAKDGDEFVRRYNRNGVYVVRRGQAALPPPLFPDLGSTRLSSLDAQANVFFMADGGPKEGLRIRRAGVDGSRQSWSYPPDSSTAWGAHVSRDGRYFVMAVTRRGGRPDDNKLMLLDTASGAWREVVLPREARRINR